MAKAKQHTRKKRGYHRGRLEMRSGKWLAIWMVNGKRTSQSTGTADRDEAERWLARRLALVRMADEARRANKEKRQLIEETAKLQLRGALDDIDNERKRLEEDTMPALRVCELWDTYVKSTRRNVVAESTLSKLETRWRKFHEWLKKNHPDVDQVREVTADIAAEFAGEIREAYSANTFYTACAAYQQIWSTLAAEIRGSNPWTQDNIRRKMPMPTKCALTDEQLRRIFEAAREDAELYDLFTILLFTGLRISDGARLEWRHVDLARGFIDVEPVKTRRFGKIVHIPILPPLRAMLEGRPGKREGYVLARLGKSNLKTLGWRVCCLFRRCGVPSGGAHLFRHTFVSVAAAAGVPLAVVQAVVGHATSRMTGLYFHESDAGTAAAFGSFPDRRIAAAIGCGTGGVTVDAEVIEESADRFSSILDGMDGAALRALRDEIDRRLADA